MKKKTIGKLDTTSLENSLVGVENKVSPTIKHPYSFKGRKSPLIIEKIINTFTNKNDKVLDPFMGSATTLIAAVAAKRYFTGIELDNYTYNVDKALFEKLDKSKLDSLFNKIKGDISTDINFLYETKCHGVKNHIKKLYFDIDSNSSKRKDGYFKPKKNREIKDNCNIILLEKCPICHRNKKKFSNVDWEKILEIEGLSTKGFPNDRYIENSRINITKSTGADRYDRIFSHRNQVALLMLQNEISTLKDSPEKSFLEQVLASSLKLARIAMYGSSTDILYHVVKTGCQDANVWVLFESQYKDFLHFKNEFKKTQKVNFENNQSYETYQGDYLKILKTKLSNKRFDMIFTDFPYTDQVPYLERNQLFRVWLNHFGSHPEKYKLTQDMLDAEIVVSNAPKRKEKNYPNFYKDIDNMFAEFNNHLDVGKNVVLFTKLGNKKYLQTYSSVIQMAKKNGFELVAQLSVDKDDPTLRKQSAFSNTPINEIIVAFEKLDENSRYLFVSKDSEWINYDDEIDRYVYHVIHDSDKHEAFMPELLNHFDEELLDKYNIISSTFQKKKIKSIISNDFEVLDNQTVHLKYEKLYTDLEDKRSLFLKLLDWVPAYIDELFNEKGGKFVLEDLYIKLIDKFSSGESTTLTDLLSSDVNTEEVRQVLEMHCDIENGFYVKKHLPKSYSGDALDLLKVDPYEFERICVDLLTQMGFLNVQEVGGSGDFGIDIVAQKPKGALDETYLIQCKRWINNVGSTPIQRLHSELMRQNADKAICITTAKFTHDGKIAAEDDGIELIDGEELLIKLNEYYPGKYYNSVFLTY